MNEAKQVQPRSGVVPAASAVGCSILLACLAVGCQRVPATPAASSTHPALVTGTEIAEASPEQVRTFCGACHAYPRPDSFPRSEWREEVERGYHFFKSSTLRLDVPPMPGVVKYYENRAPAELPLLPQTPPDRAAPFQFERTGYRGTPPEPPAAVANVRWAPLADARKLDVLGCEMLRGQILVLRPYEPDAKLELLSDAVSHPAHIEVVDLNKDGIKDLLVANLGNFYPTDVHTGSVVWLRGQGDGRYVPVTLLERVGRVADVQAADFDGDGDLDLVAAVFGWRATGAVVYLENRTTDDDRPAFVPRILDPRSGAIHVPVADLNGDGRPDFVAVFSQEHEVVVAFLNEGQGTFAQKTIYAAPDPSYGSSGIQLVDLDGDGRLDVLYTNGDTLDKTMLRPYHGVRWLRNEGAFPFTEHLLTNLYGVHRALAADLDGDGDLDIVAVSFMPEPRYTALCQKHQPDAVVVLEQVAPRQFQRYSLETVTCDHATCDVGDFDGDGRIDLVTGNFSTLGAPETEPVPTTGPPRFTDWITVWKNVTAPRANQR